MSVEKTPYGTKEKKFTNQTIILLSFLISIVSMLPISFLGTSFMVMTLSFTLTDCYP